MMFTMFVAYVNVSFEMTVRSLEGYPSSCSLESGIENMNVSIKVLEVLASKPGTDLSVNGTLWHSTGKRLISAVSQDILVVVVV